MSAAAPATSAPSQPSGLRADARPRGDRSPITYERVPTLGPHTRLLTMGSCFAVEIRQAMRRRGLRVLPELSALRPAYEGVFTYVVPGGETPLSDEVVDRYIMQWYLTATMRQEYERAAGLWSQHDSDLWFARGIWQDPYRRSLFSRDRPRLLRFIRLLDRLMGEAIEQADLHVLTLGLIEGWRKRDNGLFAADCPGTRHDQRGVLETTFERLDFAQCLADMTSICRSVHGRWPHKHIVVSVSPVPLGRTFARVDHAVANCESKSILRTVAGELARRFANVHYFHSYEMCLLNPAERVFEEDGRHVQPAFVEEILATFTEQFAFAEGTCDRPMEQTGGEVR